ncbi:DSBA oxidoreductase [Pandoraea terrae]|uniref:Thiol:disulfide interchange protein n=1 Tax=Pandoraea terrae TaxID=1537710 RepID=A0A5E4YF36_9BURK|nr:thiol:disulfide interchange protein DsbA/DsbL [Pandoraea terrae]VVE47406.1 DSBA oxidoreductase [Pandoraea terrae]
MKKILGAVLVSLGFLAGTASASPAAPVAGVDYTVLQSPQPTDSAGKIEVTEFFWYGCPHCNALEPSLEQWVKKQRKDIVFKRVPVAFQDRFEPHTRMFYALVTLGREADLTPKVFHAIHDEKNYLLTSQTQADYLAQFGVDKKAYLDAYNSFTTQTNVKRAKALTDAYKIDGVPALAIQGKYLASPATTGDALTKAGHPPKTEQETFDAALQTVDSIIQQVRAKKL